MRIISHNSSVSLPMGYRLHRMLAEISSLKPHKGMLIVFQLADFSPLFSLNSITGISPKINPISITLWWSEQQNIIIYLCIYFYFYCICELPSANPLWWSCHFGDGWFRKPPEGPLWGLFKASVKENPSHLRGGLCKPCWVHWSRI